MEDLETIFTNMKNQPYQINKLTEQYLRVMASSYNPAAMRWEEVQEIMREIQDEEN